MLEILRRIVLLFGLLSAIATALAPAPALLAVRPVDMAAKRARALAFAREETLEAYIAKQTEGRLIQVTGQPWEAFFAAVSATADDSAPSREWNARRGRDFYDDTLYFRPDEAPLSTLTNGPNASKAFTYLALSKGGQVQYLGLTYTLPRDAVHSAPALYLYPYRRYSLWLLLVALALYVLLPRPKIAPEALHYSRMRATILPDLVGCILVAAFFTVPLFVIPANASDPSLLNFSDGWAYLTLICWALASGGVLIMGWSAWYATYQLQLLPDRLRLVTWRGAQDYPYEEIEAVGMAQYRTPRGWIALGIVTSLISWRALGPTLLLASQERTGMEVCCKDGRKLRIWLQTLIGGERLLEAFERAGVPVADEVRQLPVDEDSSST